MCVGAGWAVGWASPFGRLRPAGPLGPAGGGGALFSVFLFIYIFSCLFLFVVSFISSFIKLPLVPNLYLPINYYEINS